MQEIRIAFCYMNENGIRYRATRIQNSVSGKFVLIARKLTVHASP